MEENKNVIDLEKAWNLKTEAHNNIVNYLESKGLNENDLLHASELIKNHSQRAIELNSLLKFDIKI